MANAVAKHFLGNITHNLSVHNVSKKKKKNATIKNKLVK